MVSYPFARGFLMGSYPYLKDLFKVFLSFKSFETRIGTPQQSLKARIGTI